MGGPTLQIVDPQGIWLADLFGFILSLPISLFLAYWISNVKRPMVTVIGAFIGCFLGFLIILGWVFTLVFHTSFPRARTVLIFFGPLLFHSTPLLVFSVFSALFFPP